MIIETIDNSRSQGGRFRWRTRSKGRIGVWSESYHNRADRDASIEAHQRMLPEAEVKEVKR